MHCDEHSDVPDTLSFTFILQVISVLYLNPIKSNEQFYAHLLQLKIVDILVLYFGSIIQLQCTNALLAYILWNPVLWTIHKDLIEQEVVAIESHVT